MGHSLASRNGVLREAAAPIALGWAILAAPCGAAAADAVGKSSGDSTQLSEVVVTVERREETLMNVPQAVQAISGAELERLGYTDLIDTIRMIPGASIPATISAGTEVYQIRGVAAGQAIGDSTVGFYLDEFAFSIPGLPFAPSANVYDLQRVEVVRGPSGTLYGQGSLGGTIKVLTNPPKLDVWEGSLSFSGSSTSDGAPNGSADGMLNIPVVPGKLALRGVLSFDHLGGYVDLPHLGVKDANDKTEIFGRAKLLFVPTDRLRITLGYWRDDVQQGVTNRMDQFDPPTANDTGPGKSPLSYSLYTGDIDYDLGFADLLSATGYLDESFSLVAVGSQPAFGNYNITTGNFVKSLSEEVRLTSKSAGPFNWVAGAFYRDSEIRATSAFTVTIPGLTATSDNLTTSHSWAIYGEASLKLFGGHLIPTVGGRYFSDDRALQENSGLLLFGPPPQNLGPFLETISGRNSAFSPHFNLAYHPNGQGMFYVEVSKGFRSGAIQGNTPVLALKALGIQASTSLGPDTLWNYEIGTKWRLFDNRLQVELAAYTFNWGAAQLQYSPAGLSSIIAAGDVNGRGLDLTTILKTPIEGLTLQASGNINRTDLQHVPAAVSGPLPWLGDGKPLPGTPNKSAMVMADYRLPVGNGFHIALNGTYSYRDKQRDIVTGADSASLNLIGLRAGGGNERFEAFVFVENLTDDRGPSSVDSGRYEIPYPRQVGVSLQTHF
ncbi:MAG: fyuA [Caulobacteraceae bacterium]|nr:fyuA [Caulobacteraceae bacterium]